jgi:starch synthase
LWIVQRGVVSAAVEILLITSEIAPYSRTGELGDVCAALPKALRSMGHKVTVLSPLWSGIDPTARGLARRLTSIEVNLGAWRSACTLHDGRTTGGVELVFIGHGETFAGGPGEGSREAQLRAALVFASAAAQVAAARHPAPEVLHAHGWFAAAALALAQGDLPAAARVLSLHDAEHIGDLHGLPEGVMLPSALVGQGSLLLAGVNAAARVVASSHDEAERLRAGTTPLARALQSSTKLLGISNGLDAARWNALTDPLLPARFDPVDLSGKARCKDALQLELGLPIRSEVPLLACLGSSAAKLLPQIAGRILLNDVQLVVLGADAEEVAVLSELGSRYEERLRLVPDADERMRHRVVAAADIVLVPAHDPHQGDLHLCAQRYGALPVVRKVAAMADAVVDCDAELVTGNGFVFEQADAEELLAVTQRALAAFAKRKPFDALRRRVMKLDVSWERAARRYEYVYKAG